MSDMLFVDMRPKYLQDNGKLMKVMAQFIELCQKITCVMDAVGNEILFYSDLLVASQESMSGRLTLEDQKNAMRLLMPIMTYRNDEKERNNLIDDMLCYSNKKTQDRMNEAVEEHRES